MKGEVWGRDGRLGFLQLTPAPQLTFRVAFREVTKQFIITGRGTHVAATEILRSNHFIILAPSPASESGVPRSYSR